MALLGTLFTFSVTALGAANVFFVRKDATGDFQSVSLGFAGGVMVAASVWSLLIPAIHDAERMGQVSWLVAASGFLLGVILLLAADRILDWYRDRKKNQKKKNSMEMLIFAITCHNIPEGMAVGLAFALAARNPGESSLLSGAVALTIGIGIQNYPEGTAVALPLRSQGASRRKAFFIGSLSALVEPLSGVLAAALATVITVYMPLLLSLAAGTMIYVVVQELIPESHMGQNKNMGTLGFVVGFLVMMILDVALG